MKVWLYYRLSRDEDDELRKKFPKKRTTSPVSVKWVLNEEIFKIFRSKPAKPSSGY